MCLGIEKLRSKQHVLNTAGTRHGHCMACVIQTRSHCVNQLGTTKSKYLATWHGRGKEGVRQGIYALALTVP